MKLILTAAAVLFATAATAQMAASPTTAMSPMAGDAMMAGVPAGAQKKIMTCKAMAHDAMMKSAMCTKMMKLYPNAFGSASSN